MAVAWFATPTDRRPLRREWCLVVDIRRAEDGLDREWNLTDVFRPETGSLVPLAVLGVAGEPISANRTEAIG
ncbi:hypothetical protein MKUB_21350 [Mycobacterium kubicae]|uniref:Uncharacterized protein n=1 Tax=Mycobacterium kubicae TaxID=120959 RepID=A0ABQ1BLS7_9MYCO|nr:hypothetical protein MKUB_21350 [Mycobacterium kubicae]